VNIYAKMIRPAAKEIHESWQFVAINIFPLNSCYANFLVELIDRFHYISADL